MVNNLQESAADVAVNVAAETAVDVVIVVAVMVATIVKRAVIADLGKSVDPEKTVHHEKIAQ